MFQIGHYIPTLHTRTGASRTELSESSLNQQVNFNKKEYIPPPTNLSSLSRRTPIYSASTHLSLELIREDDKNSFYLRANSLWVVDAM